MYFNPDNKLLTAMGKIFDLMMVSLLWAACCLTIVGIGPATSAMYYTVVKTIRRERESVFRSFFRSIRDSWKVTIVVGMLLALFIYAAFCYDVPMALKMLAYDDPMDIMLGVLSCLKIVLIMMLAIYVFPVVSRFQVGVVKAVSVSMIMALRHLLTTVWLTVLLTAAICMIFWQPVLILIIPGGFTFIWSYYLEKIMRGYLSAEDQAPDDKVDQWYLE